MSGVARITLVLVLGAMLLVGGVMVVLRGAQDLDAVDLGAVGNETRDGGEAFAVTVYGAARWLLLAIAALGVGSVLVLFGRRN